ncbi:MAG: hypothetical protein ACXWWJ_01155 [Nitrospira sp.]
MTQRDAHRAPAILWDWVEVLDRRRTFSTISAQRLTAPTRNLEVVEKGAGEWNRTTDMRLTNQDWTVFEMLGVSNGFLVLF